MSSSSDCSGNTTALDDDFGFENVGVTDIKLSGVYLGTHREPRRRAADYALQCHLSTGRRIGAPTSWAARRTRLQAVVGDADSGKLLREAQRRVGARRRDVRDPGVPEPARSTAVYANATIAADLAFHRTQIQTLTPPAGPVPMLPAIGGAALAARS